MPKFVPRQRKHKERIRDQNNASHELHGGVVDTNATELLPTSKSEREAKRQKLKAELRAQEPKISSKKQKRLDKYIENKLKHDEERALIAKLAKQKVDTSIFQSSKSLFGGRKVLNLPREKRESPLESERDSLASSSDSENDTSDEVSRTAEGLDATSVASTEIAHIEAPIQGKLSSTSLGSGLKRPLEFDESGQPIIKKRIKRRKVKPVVEIPWEGFDSSEEEPDSEARSESSEPSELDESNNSESANSDSDEDLASEDEVSASSEDEEDVDDIESSQNKRSKFSAFKEWATQQVNEALGFTPSAPVTSTLPPKEDLQKIQFQPRAPEQEPLPPELVVPSGQVKERKAYNVLVKRTEEIQTARMKLPIVAEEQKIMEAIFNNSTVVIWGATGSGKTTQVPQFLYEAGFGDPNGPYPGMIGVTQPRRVAAVSMANRVAEELGNLPEKVAYQIRFDSTVSDKTAIKFMTDGILLREISQDFALAKYSIIIIDEAHERSTNTDILIGMISRIVDLRAAMSQRDPKVKPLKFVIMSATLKISDFLENRSLFRSSPPPLVQAEGRQYPVTVHFARRSNWDYVEEAFKKIKRGHRKLPPGGMLVFLTGQNEITALARRLKNAFPTTKESYNKAYKVQFSAKEAPLEVDDVEFGGDVDEGKVEDVLHGFETDSDDDFEDKDAWNVGEDVMAATAPVHVLTLYAQLPTKDQLLVFKPPPEGSRLIVLATNVAETSLTIPGIRYVFDCGRAKDKKYDQTTGVQSFQVGWVSKASASQRAGRAGRTGPGHCYRLYSSAVYERDFEEYTKPEILRSPIEGIVLQLKSMGIQHVLNYPFPTPPDRENLAKAEKLLVNLGALTREGVVTELGRNLSAYPLSPRLSKMLAIGHQHGCMPYTIAIVSSLAVSEIFKPENQLFSKSEDAENSEEDLQNDPAQTQLHKDYRKAHRSLTIDTEADALKLMAALCAYSADRNPARFCERYFLIQKSVKEATQLRQQLTSIVRLSHPGLIGQYNPQLPLPDATQLKVLKQIVACGFIDQVAIRADLAPNPPDIPRTPRRAIDMPYITLLASHEGRAETLEDEAVYLHPSSVLASASPKLLPKYIIYSHLQRGNVSTNLNKTPKVRMHALTPISGKQLAHFTDKTPLLEYGKPIGKIENVEGEPDKRVVWIVPSLVGIKGKIGWPLPARKVLQQKTSGKGWTIEKFLD